MTWFREMASLLKQYRHAVKADRASMRALCRACPEIPRRELRRQVKAAAHE